MAHFSLNSNSARQHEKTVDMPVAEFYQILARAHAQGNRWLQDFAEENVAVSSDLYEVLQEYRYCSKAA